MEYGYKTLILIDNSISIDKGNRAIIQAIVNYMVKNKSDLDEYSLASFDENINYLTDYSATEEEIIKAINKVEYLDHKTYITDALMNTINEWHDADFAMRNIVLITDGMGDLSKSYPNEELYIKLSKNGYPVYVIGCVQENNEFVMKDLAAIARMSGGKMLYTEFEDSEANVEQKICEQLFAAIEEKRIIDEENSNEGDTINSDACYDEMPYEEGFNNETSENSEDEYYRSAEEVSESEYIYDNGEKYSLKDADSFTASKLFLSRNINNSAALGALGIFIFFLMIMLIFILVCIRGGKKRRDSDKRFINEIRKSGRLNSDSLNDYKEDKFEPTQLLNPNKKDVSYDNPDFGTRLLYEDNSFFEVTLEDMNDPTRFFRQSFSEKLIIGRLSSESDIVIDYDASVSARHCEIGFHDESFYICDLSSSNGTWLNGRKVQREVNLNSGDLIRIGHSEFRISLERAV